MPLRARYTDVDPSNEPNRPHISSDISISKSVETKITEMRPIFLARPASIPRIFSALDPFASPLPSARLAPRWCISAPPVRGVLSLTPNTRNPFFQQYDSFLNFSTKPFNNSSLRKLFSCSPSETSAIRQPRRRHSGGNLLQTVIHRLDPVRVSADSYAQHRLFRDFGGIAPHREAIAWQIKLSARRPHCCAGDCCT